MRDSGITWQSLKPLMNAFERIISGWQPCLEGVEVDCRIPNSTACSARSSKKTKLEFPFKLNGLKWSDFRYGVQNGYKVSTMVESVLDNVVGQQYSDAMDIAWESLSDEVKSDLWNYRAEKGCVRILLYLSDIIPTEGIRERLRESFTKAFKGVTVSFEDVEDRKSQIASVTPQSIDLAPEYESTARALSSTAHPNSLLT